MDIDLSKVYYCHKSYYCDGVKCDFSEYQIKEFRAYKFWSKVLLKANTSLCWEWGGAKNIKGYGQFSLKKNGILTSEKSHRESYRLSKGEIPKNIMVCHSCDNPSCCNPNHLFLGTNSENMKDMYKKGRGNDLKGENNKLSKIKNDDISEIFLLYSQGFNFAEIGRKFNVSYVCIANIIKRKTWKHIDIFNNKN